MPKETLLELLEIAQRAPSGTNTQPWHVYLCAGELTIDVLAMAESGQGASYEDFDYPVGLGRYSQQPATSYNLVGIEKR